MLTDVSRIEIVDVGAASHGAGTEPYAGLMQRGAARVIGFEPDQAECTKVNAMYGNGGNIYFPYFIGDGSAATYYETNVGQTGSLYRPNKPVLSAFANLEHYVQLQKTHAVQTTRLDDIAEITDVDFIKIDVQGAELNVFKGARRALEQTVIIQTEVEFVELYENQPLFADVDQFLRAQGFMFHSFLSLSGRTFQPVVRRNEPFQHIRQMLWSDALYVRDFRRFETLSVEKLKRLAVLLHDLFQSCDLCLKVLQEIDRRQDSDLATAYFDRLPDHLDLGWLK